ncbi:hypothetical protein [Pediococcus acidilactici]|uniref:Uncharacterized protein n=1 Tax=Pediococcus acidilactici TaxID=1254 RepID=A0AAW8YMS3_PEDAC|nr:hypothetical protein [Pediococcus acidilactici]MDB8860117.1 hypothetical protein [Pediococcus acidilactici]MDB8861114.1 hypothetical protein [Pediococcus acidilactici]MDB8863845.1 hypothetical protein [Pediococcus acidilactici]MDB8866005.1 hypothetical protein [Pediococcus acidilactici]MDV2911041.1 hypothetical protein [Pediococcus acidilactici]
MKRRIVRGLNYFTQKGPTVIKGSDSPYYIAWDNQVVSNYRTVQAYLFKHGGK